MAESALEKLQRLARERKAGAVAQPAPAKTEVIKLETGNVTDRTESSGETEAETNREHPESTQLTGHSVSEAIAYRQNVQPVVLNQGSASSIAVSELVSDTGDSNVSVSTVGTSDHPLAMQFAELEAALLAKTPEFKTILRQVHRHLGQEPELVTQMTEAEIQLVVSGLVVFANAEIVAPAAAKTAKAKIAAAKKQPISADDL